MCLFFRRNHFRNGNDNDLELYAVVMVFCLPSKSFCYEQNTVNNLPRNAGILHIGVEKGVNRQQRWQIFINDRIMLMTEWLQLTQCNRSILPTPKTINFTESHVNIFCTSLHIFSPWSDTTICILRTEIRSYFVFFSGASSKNSSIFVYKFFRI